jgi:phosphoglycolate phosphatase-like HAD superfamily hydrolase
MSRPEIQLVITDLDNTLYDWYSAFVPAFYAMVREAAPILGVDEQRLLDELQVVHRRHGSAEHPFALLETEAVASSTQGLAKRAIMARFDPAFHAFNSVRKQNLKLYDGVLGTLEQLRRMRVPVVAYTDARVVNSLARLRKLGVKPLIDRLYAPATVLVPEDSRDLDSDFVRLLPAGDRKPNPRTLADICTEYNLPTDRALYVGDSLVRDIFMARMAHLPSAWARYGTQYDRELWRQLVRVTHWTDEDVRREQALSQEAEGVEPDCVLDRFNDILNFYRFVPGAQRGVVTRSSAATGESNSPGK